MSTNRSQSTQKKLRPSIRYDGINPRDYFKYDFIYNCEQCTHFDTAKEQCTLGYHCEPHRKKVQDEHYELTGRMALCRFLEID